MISLYCASKFALEGFSEALAYELASQNIVVKLVIPHGGVTATRFSERGRRTIARWTLRSRTMTTSSRGQTRRLPE
ncbi:MAG TPA: SDR family NAD(P)-dependent oxidoreductase [Verrucomicrobiae bacterium]|nr:SDR family NAD(P)-dependent oxidoreductase [Verrucomicrobiae bacterium]